MTFRVIGFVNAPNHWASDAKVDRANDPGPNHKKSPAGNLNLNKRSRSTWVEPIVDQKTRVTQLLVSRAIWAQLTHLASCESDPIDFPSPWSENSTSKIEREERTAIYEQNEA